MTSNTHSKSILPTSLWVLLGAILLSALLLLISPQRAEIDPNLLPWNSHYTAADKLQALGLTLESSSVQDAKVLFGNDVEVQIFSKKDESGKTAEVFFPTIAIGTITGSLTLSLAVPVETLNQMYTRGVKTTVTPLGNRQVTPVDTDQQALLAYPIKNLTLIPKSKLTEEGVKKRFGNPNRISHNADGSLRWIYVDKGLELIFNPDGPTALQYYRVQ